MAMRAARRSTTAACLLLLLSVAFAQDVSHDITGKIACRSPGVQWAAGVFSAMQPQQVPPGLCMGPPGSAQLRVPRRLWLP